jgi:hypothetical protein
MRLRGSTLPNEQSTGHPLGKIAGYSNPFPVKNPVNAFPFAAVELFAKLESWGHHIKTLLIV